MYCKQYDFQKQHRTADGLAEFKEKVRLNVNKGSVVSFFIDLQKRSTPLNTTFYS